MWGRPLPRVRETGCLVGLTHQPSTPPQAVFPYLDELDLVLVMGVEPGFGGQKFIPTTVSRVAAIKAECNRRGVSPRIEVDGGINTETASLCAQPEPVFWSWAARFLRRRTVPRWPNRFGRCNPKRSIHAKTS